MQIIILYSSPAIKFAINLVLIKKKNKITTVIDRKTKQREKLTLAYKINDD